MAAKTNQKKETPLNDVLVVILLIGVIGGIFQIINSFRYLSQSPVAAILSILFTAVAMYGIYLILSLKKAGYWLLILPKLIDLVVVVLVSSGYGVKDAVVMDLGGIAIISLLMLLRKNGKNAYQLLWGGYCTEKEWIR